MWKEAKDDTEEGRIIEFCDFISVLGFLLQEGIGSGNKTIERHVADMGKYFSKFQLEEYNFIRPLVEQACLIMGEVFNGE